MAAGTGISLSQSHEGNRTVFLAQNYLFLDAAAHDPSTDSGLLGFADLRQWLGMTIFAFSTLNAQTTLRLIWGLGRVTAAGSVIPQTVSDLVIPAWTSGDPQRGIWSGFHVQNSTWAPYAYVQVNPLAAAAPTAGGLTVVCYKTEYACIDPQIAGS